MTAGIFPPRLRLGSHFYESPMCLAEHDWLMSKGYKLADPKIIAEVQLVKKRGREEFLEIKT
ncbi:hypothetical protein E2C01_082336 [Portunus trituberculatus]|uniref:Uncharacterized protein n=1 Tax=Portunus trituberculatus TaxID=210409 RepID=A0A5B7J4N6_PORTR|nr:hypothetical protein [Portunus trituberculatus]